MNQTPEQLSENKSNPDKKQDQAYYECKICLCDSVEPVVTLCGHLFCWPCIYQWSLSKKSEKVPCPTCNNSVEIKKVIPLYTSQENHQKKYNDIPNRPRPERNNFQQNQNDPNNMNFQFYFNGFGFNFGAMNWNGENAATWKRILSLLPVLIFLLAPSILELFFKFWDIQAISSDKVVYIYPESFRRDVYNRQNTQFERDNVDFDNPFDNILFENIGIVGILTSLFLVLTIIIVFKSRR